MEKSLVKIYEIPFSYLAAIFVFVFDFQYDNNQIIRERKMEAEESMTSNFNKSSFANDRSSSLRNSTGKRKKTNAERIGLHKEKR